MKTIAPLLLGSFLLLGTVACSNPAKTSADAPSPSETMDEAPSADATQDARDDATNDIRQDQLNADIRAREQRNDLTGGDADRANADLASEVRSKLEANIPGGHLTVVAKDGMVDVSGTVPTQADLSDIESLAKDIKGVKTVNVSARVGN